MFLESFKRGGLGKDVWYSPDAAQLPRWCNDALVCFPPSAIVGDVNDQAARQSTWALFLLLFWYITSWLGAGEVMSYRVSSSPPPPPHRLPLTSPLLWLEQLQNQLVVRCFLGIVWGRAVRLFIQSALSCLHTQKHKYVKCLVVFFYCCLHFQICINPCQKIRFVLFFPHSLDLMGKSKSAKILSRVLLVNNGQPQLRIIFIIDLSLF